MLGGSKEEVYSLVMGSPVQEKKGEGIPPSKKTTERVLERIQERQWP